MNKNNTIDDLLNGLIDGELTPRQLTEVQRLVSHDEKILDRLRDLQRTRVLVSSLPTDNPPEELLNDIMASIERKTLLGEEAEFRSERKGVFQLVFRKLAAAAAMLTLVAGLGFLIYNVIWTQDARHTIVKTDWNSFEPVDKPLISDQPDDLPGQPATAKSDTFQGSLELLTDDLNMVDSVVANALKTAGLSATTAPGEQPGVYAVECDRDQLNHFLADISNIWPRVKNSKLILSGQSEIVQIDNIKADQIAALAALDTNQNRIQQAKQFAAKDNNNLQTFARNSSSGIDDGMGNILLPPKPVLTSGDDRLAGTEKPVRLIISVKKTAAEN